MNMEDVTFDSFMSLPHKMRKQILNDPDAIKILIRKNLKKKIRFSLGCAKSRCVFITNEQNRYNEEDE